MNLSVYNYIPSQAFAYWISQQMIIGFSKGIKLGLIVDSKQGLSTADNNRFLRLWHESDFDSIFFTATDSIQAMYTGKKWFPFNKGGDYRKWYGNNEYIINYQNNGRELQNFNKSVIRNSNYYFQECFSWSLICSSIPSFRYKPNGYIFDAAGSSCFGDNIIYLLGLCNSVVTKQYLKFIAPTLNFSCGDIANIPVIKAHERIVENIVKDNIDNCRKDWDEFETSWDFKKHPLV